MAELLKHESIEKVIGVAHDWFVPFFTSDMCKKCADANRGSFLLSRMVNYHGSLFSKLVFSTLR